MSELQLPGRTLGPFEIISELGRGGMAVVYKARQSDLQRIVALKILPPALSLDRSSLQRFLQEARSAAALEHPHIVPIYAIGEAAGFNYIAMKFIAGQTLKDIAQERGALDLPQAIGMIEQVADALDYAHSKGMIHRDIKPSNMMAEQNGWVYLTDFGLARGGETSGLTVTGTVMGTPEYMSPEQAQGLATIGPATDIYALGVVVYELLTGQVPFQADTPMGMLVARLQYAPRPPRDYRGDLPLGVEDVIMRALARRPEARFASAHELVAALKQAAGLGTRTFAPQQRPISPPLGVPAQPARPVSPAYGAPAQPVSPASGMPTLPASPPAGVPAQPARGTPPYVIPADNQPPPAAYPPPPPPAGQFGSLPTVAVPAGSPAAPKPRARLGMVIGLGILALLIVAGLGFMLARPRGPDPRIAQAIEQGWAALERPGGGNETMAAARRALELDPNSQAAHSQLALVYILRDRAKDAEAAARAAIAAAPQAALPQALLAEALSNRGEYQQAIDAANKAIELDAKLAFAYAARANARAGQAGEGADADLLAEAAADADRAIELAEGEQPVGQALAGSRRQLDQALAHNARGYVYYQEYSITGEDDALDRGIAAFQAAIDLQGQIALFHSNQGYLYDAKEQHDEALAAFERALAADAEYGHTHAGLGWNLYYLSDYPGALGEFDKALEQNPDDVDAYIGRSYALQSQDEPDYDQALAMLNKAAEVAPSNPNVRANLGWAQRSQAIGLEYGSDAQKEGYAAAEQHFRDALAINGRYADALTGLGWALQDQANLSSDAVKYQESIDALLESLAIKERQSGAHNALGWSYYWLKQYGDAEQAFQRAIELNSDYADAQYGLGRTLEDQGQADAAREAYAQAVANGSNDAQTALERLK